MGRNSGDRNGSPAESAPTDVRLNAPAAAPVAPVIAATSLRTTLAVWAILFTGVGLFAWAAAHAAHRVQRSALPAAATQTVLP